MTDNNLAINSIKTLNLIKTKVLVVGDIMLDRYWNGNVDRISPEGPFPVLDVREIEDRLSGAANVAKNIADVGATPYLMGSVGDDDYGRMIYQLLDQNNIQHTLMTSILSTTTLKIRAVANKRQLIRLDFDNKHCSPVDLVAFQNQLTHSDIVLVSDYGKGVLNEIDGIINLSNAAKKRVLIDPKGSFEKYHNAYLISPNKSELRSEIGTWSSEHELEQKVFLLLERINVEAILLTRSEEGMTLYTRNNEAISIPSIAREVFDVSGAGDTVLAFVALGLGSGLSLVESMLLSNIAAGIVVGKFGTSSLTLEELLKALEAMS